MDIERIVNELEKGNLVVTPTDTIYGIMGDSTNEETIKKVYKVKKRPYNKPLILLMDSYQMIKEYTKNITIEEEILIKEFMPGLVTIILEKNNKVNNIITSNTNYVGIRIPKNEDLLKIIKKLGKPVISTSANISEEEIPISIEQLDQELKTKIDYISDGGIQKGSSSTIVKFTNNKLQIIRDGILSNKIKERFNINEVEEMNIKELAKQFAINAHRGQRRKSDIEKPMIIHPIDVGNILEQYNYDESVIAAGYLHDVIEDTKYTKEDIEKHFGKDITSLVVGASEPDKTLSWEERKKHTIKTIKKLDLRHKAVVCADKISNLEDLRIMSEIKGEYNFSCFKRGIDSQRWYYTEIYKSLITNEDKNLPMFIRLNELIEHIFYNKTNDEYIKNVIFKDKQNEYKKLINFHYKKEEIFKLKNIQDKNLPYVIEFTGTPRTGKTTLINNIYDFFKKKGFKVDVLEEFTTSQKYKKDIYPTLKDKYKNVINTEIPKYVLEQLNESIKKQPDIILIDRSLFDRLIWVDRLYLKKGMTKKEYDEYKKLYIPLIKEKINIIISTYTDSLTSLKRDYNANLSLEKRNFLNETNINEYNNSLLNMQKLSKKENINFYLFDTTNKNQREISFEIIDIILNDMRKIYLNKINEQFR